MMQAYYDREKKEYSFHSSTVKEMLKELKILKNSVIVAVNGRVVTEDYCFVEGDEVRILSVVSGG